MLTRQWDDTRQSDHSEAELNDIFLLHYLFLKNALSEQLKRECNAETVFEILRNVSTVAIKAREMKDYIHKTAIE